MPRKSIQPNSFWKELKQRKVVRVTTVYTATAFIILQLLDIISQPLKLPEWTMTLMIVLLCAGLIVTIVLTWVYDITPSGIKRTKPASAVKVGDQITHSVSNLWKIATYISAIIIVFLLVFNIIGRRIITSDVSNLEKSIAVLPFINDSPLAVEENVPFINGLMEEILINLQTIKEFRVPGRTSVEKYRNKTDKSITDIAKELGVNYIVEGSGQRYNNSLRLRVQLIKATGKETHLWAKSYEEKINKTEDIFDLQSSIAKAIALELQATISPEEEQKIEKIPKANLDAYDAFLNGLYFYEKGSMLENDKAITWFNKSITLDSTYALPWTYLSMCYWRRAHHSNDPDFITAKQKAMRAVELDPTSGVSVVNMAEILDNEYDFKGAEEKIKVALSIEPDKQYVLRNACRFYTKVGKFEEAIGYCKEALKTDPTNPTVLQYEALANYYAGNVEKAWDTFDKFKELENSNLTMTILYYKLLLNDGNYDKILTEPAFEGEEEIQEIAKAAAEFAAGNKEEAERLCKILIEKNTRAYEIALIYAYGNNPQKMYEWLERSYNQKETVLTYLGVEPAFRKFRNDSQFRKLMQKINLPVSAI